MFDFVEDAFDNMLDVCEDTLNFDVDEDKIIKLAQDGMSVYAIVAVTGQSAAVIEAILDD